MVKLGSTPAHAILKLMSYSIANDRLKIAIGVVMLACLSWVYATWTGYNSDALYAYSQSIDLIQFASLSGWTFSAIPFFFPDVLVSLPFAAILKDPLIYYFATAPVQIILLVALLSMHLSSEAHVKFSDAFLTSAVAAAILALIGPAILGRPFFFMVQPYFVLVHHGFAALCAVVLFLFFRKNDYEKPYNNKLLALVIFVLLTLSDFYFALYFGLLILANFSVINWQRHAIVISVVGTCSILIFLISFVVNPSLGLHLKHSATASHLDQVWKVLMVVAILLVPGLVLSWIYFANSRVTALALRLFLSLTFVAVFLLLAGQIKDQYSYRYLTIVFAISTYLLSIAVLQARREMPYLVGAVVFSLIALNLIFTSVIREKKAWQEFADEVQCIEKLDERGSTVVAEYWPAKIIFESLGREHNLIQVDARLGERNWIYNSNWRSIHSEKDKTYLVVMGIDGDVMEKIRTSTKSELTCEGRLLLINQPAWDVLPFAS